MLRFRDLVTERGGTVAEHRKIIRQRGYVWWGWWSRQRERVPTEAFRQLFPSGGKPVETILFDRGMMRLYRTWATTVAVAPSQFGISSPDLEATPEYYIRGRYPAWFRFENDIQPVEELDARLIARPTEEKAELFKAETPSEGIDLDKLIDDRATLWIIACSNEGR